VPQGSSSLAQDTPDHTDGLDRSAGAFTASSASRHPIPIIILIALFVH